MQAFGLYTHIRANRIRSGFLLVGLFLLVYVMVFAGALIVEAFAYDEPPLDVMLARAFHDLVAAFPWATIAALVWLFIAYQFNRGLIALATGAHAVTRQQEPKLYQLLENLCVSRGLTMPRLYIMESPVLNAFASGMNEKQYAVTVTRGLMETLDDQEMEAVLAHELTHIRNGDVRLMVIAVVIAGVISFFGELLFRGLTRMSFGAARPRPQRSSSDGDRKGGGGAAFAAILIALALIALSWLLSQVIRFALSRSREYLADAGAVELTKNPDAMISALLKIEGRGELPTAPSAVMEMCIDNPRSGFTDLFATHPSIASRVDRLVRFGGGRMPELPPPANATDGGTEANSEPHAGPWGTALPGNASQQPAPGPSPSPSRGSIPRGPWGPLFPPGGGGR
ncbi:Protease HtpX homolog [Hyphomicrobiales bacterium]|nr:Protease HtpX homolog [Hyphomicrobiales bacterium]CAH1675474.1 Protease HtpX homolog [Hyphomicrobiales bacterium]